MATKQQYPPIICRRCNEFQSSFTKCGRADCDFEEYRNAIWDFFEKSPPPKYYFTLTGGVNAGKTFYLISLIYDLLYNRDTSDFLKKHGIKNVMMIDPVSDKYFRGFIEDAKYGRLALTQALEPLSFFSLFIFDFKGNPTELVFFNTSGEKIEDEFLDRNVRSKAHELKGSAILHLVDPREDSKLNSLLNNPKDLSYGPCKDYDIVDFMHRLMQFANKGITTINNPVAICISKFDLLMHRIPYDIPEGVFATGSVGDYFGDVKAKSKSLSTFLDDYSATINLSLLKNKYKRLECFAVAPFGSDDPPMWDKRNPKGILDPFLWVLNELKLLPELYGT